MPNIHPTAIIDSQAELADNVEVGPCSIVGPDVRISDGTRIGAHVVIESHTTIGRYNRICHHVCLGQDPQDLKYHGEPALLNIGDHNDIRENVTVHIGTENGGGVTSIGSHNLLMIAAHVAHDSHIGDHCVLANNVMLAGHITIGDHAVLAGGAAIHHYVTIGRHAMVGGVSGVVHDCPPYMISDGHPARVHGPNVIGMTRHQFDPQTIEALKRSYIRLYGQKARRDNNMLGALAELEQEYTSNEHVIELCRFVRAAGDDPHGRQSELQRRDDKRSTPTR